MKTQTKSNEKCCGKCKTEKLHSEFNKNASTKDGLQDWCRECHNELIAERRMRAKQSGVYLLECVIAGETYVGQTTMGLDQRLWAHRATALGPTSWMTTPTEKLPPVHQCIRQFPEKNWWRITWLAQMPDATEEELLEAEKQFIADIRPTLNVCHNPDKDSRI